MGAHVGVVVEAAFGGFFGWLPFGVADGSSMRSGGLLRRRSMRSGGLLRRRRRVSLGRALFAAAACLLRRRISMRSGGLLLRREF